MEDTQFSECLPRVCSRVPKTLHVYPTGIHLHCLKESSRLSIRAIYLVFENSFFKTKIYIFPCSLEKHLTYLKEKKKCLLHFLAKQFKTLLAWPHIPSPPRCPWSLLGVFTSCLSLSGFSKKWLPPTSWQRLLSQDLLNHNFFIFFYFFPLFFLQTKHFDEAKIEQWNCNLTLLITGTVHNIYITVILITSALGFCYTKNIYGAMFPEKVKELLFWQSFSTKNKIIIFVFA